MTTYVVYVQNGADMGLYDAESGQEAIHVWGSSVIEGHSHGWWCEMVVNVTAEPASAERIAKGRSALGARRITEICENGG